MALVDTLEPQTRQRALALLEQAGSEGISLKITSALRSCDEQNAIWQQGRNELGEVIDKTKVATRARGCRSWHVYGRGFDVLALDEQGAIIHDGSDPVYTRLGQIGRDLGLKWGGDFGDPGHFEYHPGVSTEQACPDPSQCEYYAARYPESDEPVPPPPQPQGESSTRWAAPVLWVGALGALAAFALWQSRQGSWWRRLQAEGRKSPLVTEERHPVCRGWAPTSPSEKDRRHRLYVFDTEDTPHPFLDVCAAGMMRALPDLPSPRYVGDVVLPWAWEGMMPSYWKTTPVDHLSGVQAFPFSKDKLERAMARFAAGLPMDAIDIHVYPDGAVQLLDGNHRLTAARSLGLESIRVQWSGDPR